MIARNVALNVYRSKRPEETIEIHPDLHQRSNPMRSTGLLISIFVSLWAAAPDVAAQDCPGNPDAIGTSRILSINPMKQRRIGTLQYPETLPLKDREIVLTFDDGPIPPHSERVLDALAAECVKATFFILGEQATESPDIVRRAYLEAAKTVQ